MLCLDLFLKSQYKHFVRLPQSALSVEIPALLADDAAKALVKVIESGLSAVGPNKNSQRDIWLPDAKLSPDHIFKALRR
jgi:hypothetical protein